MRKWIIVSGVLLVLGIIAFLGVLNINSFIARNKDYLLDQAQYALNRKISASELEVTFLQGIGLRAKNVAIADDPAYSKDDFVRAKDLQVNLKFWPLLRGKFQVKRIILHEPIIFIVRDANGDFNFSTIGKKEKEKKDDPDKDRTPKEPESKSGLVVSLVDISNGQVRYHDQKDGTNLEFQQTDLKLEDLDSGKPLGAQLDTALFSSKQNLHLKTHAGPMVPDQNLNQLALDGVIQIDDLDFGKLASAVPKMKSSLAPGSVISGVFKVKDLKFKGTLDNLALQGNFDGTDALVQLGKNFYKPSGNRLIIATDAQYANKTVVLRDPAVKLHTLDLSSKGEISFGDTSQVNLSIESKPASLDGWDTILPELKNYRLAGKTELRATLRGQIGHGKTPDIQGVLNLISVSASPPQLPQPVKDLNATINFAGQRANTKDSTLTLGNSRIRLAVNIEKFSPLALSYSLSTPEIRAADFEKELSEDRKNDVFKSLNANGQLAMRDDSVALQAKLVSAQGTLYNIAYRNLDTSLSLAKKVLNIRSFKANALNGTLQADGEYAFDAPTPRFSVVSKIQGVDVKEFYTALSPKSVPDIRGRLNGDMKVSGSGQKWEEINPTLRGQGEAEVLQGALLNFNIAEGALSGITGMPGMTNMINPRLRKKYPATFEAKDTEFKELRASFELADGRINMKNVRLAAADYSAQGNGWADFNRNLDFKSVLMFSPQMSADIAQSAREVKYLLNNQNQIEIPFILKGKLPNVKPRPDGNYLAKVAQRGLLGKGAEELQQKFGNKDSTSSDEPATTTSKKRKKGSTEDMIRKGLEGFFKRKGD